MKNLIFSLITASLILWSPVVALAADDGGTTTNGLPNPIGSSTMTAEDLIVRITSGFLGILSLFSLVMVIYGGFQYVYSAGNPENLKKAKDTIVWALLGMVIAFLSLAIINFVVEAFKKVA